MSANLSRSTLSAPGEMSVEYPAGHVGDNSPGFARVSLAGSWTGGVVLRNSLGDGVWTLVKTYDDGPEDDIACVCARREVFVFEAAADFSGEAKVIVSQSEVNP